MDDKEKLLLEAIKSSMFGDTVGAVKPDDEEDSHTFAYLHETIEQLFRLKTVDLQHHDAICSAFSRVHDIRYLEPESDRFAIDLLKEMNAMGVPLEEQRKALAALEEVRKELLGDDSNEKDAGWNPRMDELIDATNPIDEDLSTPGSTITEQIRHNFFSNEDVRKWAKTNRAFWQCLLEDISPYLEQLGYKCTNLDQFWSLYDDPNVRVHTIYEDSRRKANQAN